jgi:hypothetical protein
VELYVTLNRLFFLIKRNQEVEFFPQNESTSELKNVPNTKMVNSTKDVEYR